MSLRGFATLNIWADDVPAAAAWYADFLGIEPYFSRPGPTGAPAYVEFRIGDSADELGIIDRAYSPGGSGGVPPESDTAPAGAPSEPGGAIMHWHVDDLHGTVRRLLEMGATEYEPITPRGEGFVTASVVDPFGNVLGVMYNPHYLEILTAAQQA
jgi:predicted enzyme related to lactoylglutathione lyase